MSGPADGRGSSEGGRHESRPGEGRPGEGHRDDRDDAFVAFLREAADAYHRPPPTPREEMWASVLAELEEVGNASRSGGPGAGRDDPPGDGAVDAARSTYHSPPETPREEMWPGVVAGWRRQREAARLRPGGRDTGRGTDSRPWSTVPAWARAAGIAAVLALGVLVGHASIDDGTPPSPPMALDDGEVPAGAVGGGAEDVEGDSPDERLPTTGSDTAAPAGEPGAEDSPVRRPDPSGTGRLTATDVEEDGAARLPAERRAEASFRAAAYAHLGRSELFLAGFRADSAEAEHSPLRARDLLSDTRLYLDWTRGDSPHLTALLQDLELVLAQIARLDESSWSRERALVLEGMERSSVLTLLRSTLPGSAEMTRARVSGL